ncbi:hypothetical protein AWE51_17035 [Aquimarina aggregata]|uniref:Uncharacterized protein n=1 Tax=Aquimarina aggregata TaxID=1642818 RepID=A0A162WSB3_9FLAO|nr:hypothetical protein AWE51_17035 [Aquimarina aggregata]
MVTLISTLTLSSITLNKSNVAITVGFFGITVEIEGLQEATALDMDIASTRLIKILIIFKTIFI